MTTTYYYTNVFDATYVDWTEVGSSPYLGAIDYPVNYIISVTGASKFEGIWDFPNSGAENSETLTGVTVDLYASSVDDKEIGKAGILIWVYDGTSWTALTTLTPDTTFSWKSKDISSIINTWAKLDACRIYIRTTTALTQSVIVDCMRLTATSTPVVAVIPIGGVVQQAKLHDII